MSSSQGEDVCKFTSTLTFMILVGSKVTEAALLECLQGCSDEDVKSVGVALGINRARLDGHSRGQRLAEVVARLYAEGVDACREMRWVDLSSALVDAGESELAKRIEVNRSMLVESEVCN